MGLRYILCILLFIPYVQVYAQRSEAGVDRQGLIYEVNKNIREKRAEDLRRLAERKQAAEIEKQRLEDLEVEKREYSVAREAAKSAMRDIPNASDRIIELAKFKCMYPPSVVLPPPSNEVEDCIAQQELDQWKELEKTRLAAEQKRKIEQERIEEEMRIAEEARKAEVEAEIQAKDAANARLKADKEMEPVYALVIVIVAFGGVVTYGIINRKKRFAVIANQAVQDCPACTETIMAAAKKCQYCGADISPLCS